jgi:1-acyl-sn-glycerol-3-phosphate acyltransferase
VNSRISIITTCSQVLKGFGALLLLSLNTMVLTAAICILALARLLAPTDAVRDRVRKTLAGIAEAWISVNSAVLGMYATTDWDISLPGPLDRHGCYLVNCNHQTWVDIPVLQRCFNRRLPLLRFFLKSQLVWVPLLGLAWWALEFPFMKRASKEQLSRRPGLKGRDLENARKACMKFRNIPVAMMNFPEGTRFSTGKRDAGQAPYVNLLKPRIGGIGQVLYALADELDGLVDVTIVYSRTGDADSAPTLWQLVSGQVPKITVRADLHPVPARLRGRNFRTDREFRLELESWIDESWRQKDALISKIKRGESS